MTKKIAGEFIPQEWEKCEFLFANFNKLFRILLKGQIKVVCG